MPTSKVYETTAAYMSPGQFLVFCDCSKRYHRFGNCKDPTSNRSECRGMAGHGCTKYTDCIVTIDENTERVGKFPNPKVLWSIAPTECI